MGEKMATKVARRWEGVCWKQKLMLVCVKLGTA
jgi:hypothetical protein